MRTLIALAALAVAQVATAETLFGSIDLVGSNVQTADPGTGAAVFVDVYNVVVDNPNDDPVGSLVLNFTGDFVQNGGQSFRDTPDFNVIFGNQIADTFAVLPSGESALAGVENDLDGVLDLAFTLSGTPRLIAPNSTGTILAVLAVPAGADAPLPGINTANVGLSAVTAVQQPISFIPEPSTAMLAGLGLLGFVARRR